MGSSSISEVSHGLCLLMIWCSLIHTIPLISSCSSNLIHKELCGDLLSRKDGLKSLEIMNSPMEVTLKTVLDYSLVLQYSPIGMMKSLLKPKQTLCGLFLKKLMMLGILWVHQSTRLFLAQPQMPVESSKVTLTQSSVPFKWQILATLSTICFWSETHGVLLIIQALGTKTTPTGLML